MKLRPVKAGTVISGSVWNGFWKVVDLHFPPIFGRFHWQLNMICWKIPPLTSMMPPKTKNRCPAMAEFAALPDLLIGSTCCSLC